MPAIDLPIQDMRRAAADPAFRAAMEALYAEMDGEIAVRRPVCINRGACCHFQDYGHRLYVTTVELAFFTARFGGPLLAGGSGGDCPYHQSGVCVARSARPAGCRIFFCDPDAQDWQGPMTERVLTRLRGLGERFSVPYAYVEWLAGLQALCESGGLSAEPSF